MSGKGSRSAAEASDGSNKKQKKLIQELSLASTNLESIPAKVIKRCAETVVKLELSDNSIKDGSGLESMTSLEQLLLDKNKLKNLDNIPSIRSVHTLWLNNNNIDNLSQILQQLKEKFPNLTYLSMLFNPCVPNIYVDDDAEEKYEVYRKEVINTLPKLEFLDSTPITEEERDASTAQKIPEGRTRPNKKLISTTPPRVAVFLAKGKPRYDGTNSEGNRFIMNDDL